MTRWSVVALLLAYGLYFGIGLTHLGLPGLQTDEAYDAVAAMELLTGRPPSSISTITLFGRPWPLMSQHHVGPTETYIIAAGFSAFGISVQALRLTELLVGAVTLGLLWLLARTWFGGRPAAIAVLLCATAPAFVWWNRAGNDWAGSLLPIALGLVLLLGQWWRTRRTPALIGAAFLLGLGFTTKILFVWLAVPVALTAFSVLGARGTWDVLRAVKPSQAAGTLMAGLLGLMPLLVHNLTDGATFRLIAANVLRTEAFEHNNLDVLHNLRAQAWAFLRMMGGSTFPMAAPSGLPLSAAALAAALAYFGTTRIRQASAHRPPPSIRRRFLLLTVVTVIPVSTVSITHIGAKYLFIIVPFAWLLTAVALSDWMEWLGRHGSARRRRIASSAAAAVIALLVLNHLRTNVLIHDFFSRTGGRGSWSDGIFALARTVESKYAGRPVVAMDWGFTRNTAFLTDGRVRVREAFEYRAAPSPTFEETCAELLRDISNVYLFHVPRHTAFKGVWEAFQRTAQRERATLQLDVVLTERDGTPNILIYTARPATRP